MQHDAPAFDPVILPDAAPALCDEFHDRVQTQRVDVESWIRAATSQGNTLAQQWASLDTLKRWLDAFRPMPRAVAEELQKFYTVSLTHHSNAIEGHRSARLLMKLCLLRAGYPITVSDNARRADGIEALVYGQNNRDDASRLTEIVAGACRASFIASLRLLATAGESRGSGGAFSRALLARQVGE